VSLPASKLTILESVDSTNNYAMALIQKGLATSGDAVFALDQHAGKGRRGKAWKSKPRANILLTILSEMQWLPVQQQFSLSMAVGLACIDFFKAFTKENIKIKWPNDIYFNDRKAGGILIENLIKGNLWQWAVCGIGLNINQDFGNDELKATSLREITGEQFEVIALARELHKLVLKRIAALHVAEKDSLLAEYNENLYARYQTVRLKKGNRVLETTIQRVSVSGELLTKDSMERKFRFDEVEWLI
jgi:BirA family transcriptional regulator, biotin operon repressor / biotin---[acetyl-CoA-carboxylase] ligase